MELHVQSSAILCLSPSFTSFCNSQVIGELRMQHCRSASIWLASDEAAIGKDVCIAFTHTLGHTPSRPSDERAAGGFAKQIPMMSLCRGRM